MKIAAIDFERANRNPARVCSAGISSYEDGADEERYYSLIRPEEDVFYFDPWNIRIHGIRPRDVLDAPDFETVYRHIYEEMEGALVVAHNASFDMGCIRAACRMYDMPVPHLRYFDTVELSRRVYPQIPHHRLNDVCDYLHIDLDHHQAGSDAYACLMIVGCTMTLAGIYDIEELLKQCGIRMYEL